MEVLHAENDDGEDIIGDDSPLLQNNDVPPPTNTKDNTNFHQDSGVEDEEEEIQRMMALQEEEEDQQQLDHLMAGTGHQEGDHEGGDQENGAGVDGDDADIHHDPNDILLDHPGDAAEINVNNTHRPSATSFIKLHYTPFSLALSLLFILYVLRTRKSLYLSIVYLTSSKISYILIGNAMLSLMVSFFQVVVKTFLHGLRLTESETISDNMRWDVTETCISLTMFRHELDVPMVIMFCMLILGKCLHWAVELRGSHLRMTEEVFYFVGEDSNEDIGNEEESVATSTNQMKTWWVWKVMEILLPKALTQRFQRWNQITPRVRRHHMKFFVLVNILSVLDLGGLTYCASHLLQNGPSVRMLFAFEAAILFASCMSTHGLYALHVLDGVVNILQRFTTPERLSQRDNEDVKEDETEPVVVATAESSNYTDVANEETDRAVLTEDATARNHIKYSRTIIFIHRLISIWRDYRATATFIIELMAVAAKFLFTFILFIIMFTIYGLPVNIIRDLYVAYQKLRRRLSSFASFRRLTADMNTRFEAVTSQEDLDSLGHTCIICRELMTVDGINGDIKKLPGCGHAFHKHCLREWLVHQQTCPTCRADIQANEARARAEKRKKENEAESEHNESKATEGQDESNANESSGDEKGDFPMLFRVSSTKTVDVVQFTLDETGKSLVHNERRLKPGTLLVCTEQKWWSWYQGEHKEGGMFLKTPDGFWIKDDELVSMFRLS